MNESESLVFVPANSPIGAKRGEIQFKASGDFELCNQIKCDNAAAANERRLVKKQVLNLRVKVLTTHFSRRRYFVSHTPIIILLAAQVHTTIFIILQVKWLAFYILLNCGAIAISR